MKYNGSDKWKQEATKKLNRIPENIIKDVKVNNESVVDEEGIANVAVPVYVSDLDDADQYVLNEQLEDFYKKNETYSREEVNNLVDTIPKFAIEVVTTLPTTQISTTTIYLIKTSETETGNLYTEFIYVNGNWEILGIQKLDLTNYYTKQEVDELISGLRTETQEAVSNLNENIISHIGDSIKHITNTERTNWDLAKKHADSTHARTDATKVEKSSTNGNIKINGSETVVYTHPSGTNPHGTTKSDVGLGNVGNFKAVSTVASQGLTDTEKSNARANIGAGTSSFSGSYNDLSNKPTIPTVGNGTVTIKQAGTSKGTFTMNQSGDTTIELTDNNTTYGVATQSANGLESAADKKKLDGIATGAEVNQNAFSNVVVGSTTISADSKTDSLTLVGSNVTITPDADNDKVTIGITKANVTSALGYTPPTTNTTYGVATSSALGLVKSGTDITVDANGNVSVNDDSHNHTYIAPKGIYTFTSSTLPNSFDLGVSTGFVNIDSGFGNFGSVLTVRSYNSGGGSLQLYAPYSPTYGGTHMKARFGNYDLSSGNSWTDLKEIAWTSDIPTSLPANGGKSDSLYGQSIENIMYVTNDTHILQLGYWNCTYKWDRATLLISSSFWGNQHGSADIIHISQDTNTNSATTVQCTLCRTKLHIKGTDREFYYKIDNTNKRIYLYAKVIGGNGYGKWSICPILFEGGTWTTEAKSNQPTTGLIAISQLYASVFHNHSTANWTGKTDNRYYQVAYSLDAQFNYDSSNSFQYNPSTKTLKAGTFHGALNGNANSSNTLINNPVMNYGWNGVNYFNLSGTAGNAAKVNDTPTTKWWHIMRFNHANSTGYYTDLAIPFNDVSLYYKRITSGSVQNNGWIKVLDSLNYNSYCLPLSGGTMTGQINKAGVGSSWVKGRDNAMERMTSINEYSPFASIKTTNGSWEIGAYNQSNYYDNLIFTYITDSDYNASNNKPTSQIRFYNNGLIEGRARLIGSYTSTATERYRQGGLEIRENNSVGNTQSDIGYAPSIGFHWSGRCAGTLCLDKDAIFHFLKQDGTRATLDADIRGNLNGYIWSPGTEILHVSGNTSFKILALDGTTVKYHTIPEYIIGSYSDSTFYKVTNVLTFKDTNNALITGDKGNFIWAVSSWSDRKLKKNIKDADVSALDKINQIQFKEFDFIDDKKFGKHQELGYIADELKEVFPECVVTVPQDKEKFGYEELDQVQDVGLIKYLAKSIQELSSIIKEQNQKIDTLQKEVDKLKRKN